MNYTSNFLAHVNNLAAPMQGHYFHHGTVSSSEVLNANTLHPLCWFPLRGRRSCCMPEWNQQIETIGKPLTKHQQVPPIWSRNASKISSHLDCSLVPSLQIASPLQDTMTRQSRRNSKIMWMPAGEMDEPRPWLLSWW